MALPSILHAGSSGRKETLAGRHRHPGDALPATQAHRPLFQCFKIVQHKAIFPYDPGNTKKARKCQCFPSTFYFPKSCVKCQVLIFFFFRRCNYNGSPSQYNRLFIGVTKDYHRFVQQVGLFHLQEQASSLLGGVGGAGWRE